ncbi:MAG: tyrosine-type recombinase/integrase [Thermodesulfobacteriota bacterium]
MGLYKRGGVWWMSFSHNGRQLRRSAETSNRTIATNIYSKVRAQVAEGKWLDRLEGESRVFGELAHKYINEYAKLHKRSWEKDVCRLNRNLLPFFGHMTVTEITPRSISAYKSHRYSKGVKAATINRELTLIKHMYTMAIREWEWCRDNPVKRVSMEKESPPRDRWLTSEEECKLLTACSERLRVIVIFALNTGMRQGEILSLRWNNVNLLKGTLIIEVTKNGDRRAIPLNGTAWDLLKEQSRIRYPANDYVFTSSTGTKIDSGHLRRDFMKALRQAGIEGFCFHDLRHTFATRLVQAGVDLYKIQRLLGHKDNKTTQRYAHHYPESLRKSVEVLDAPLTW